MSKTNKSRKVLALAGIVVLAFAAQAKATIDSNFVIKDNIEYYFQTDKSVYDLGESVQMLYRVTNLGVENVLFEFDDQVQHYFTVKDNGNLVWDIPKAGFPLSSFFVLQPNGYKEYTEGWNMLNNQGVLITPGSYNITGSLHPIALSQQDKDKYVPVSVDIQVIPEPCSLLLISTGLVCILSKRRKM